MSAVKPMTVYYMGPSPNPWKVVIVLEELGLPYELKKLDSSELKVEPYISINPNGRVPALIDPNENITLWESGAIIDYLINVYDTNATLHYTTSPEKHTTRSWEHFQMSGQGPYIGQKGWFERFHPEKLPSAIERYSNETKRIIQVIDTHLAKKDTAYLVGDKITYADLMLLPYFRALGVAFAPEIDTSVWKSYTAWLERMYARPAVATALSRWDEEFPKPSGN